MMNFSVPPDLDVKEKAVLLGASFLVVSARLLIFFTGVKNLIS